MPISIISGRHQHAATGDNRRCTISPLATARPSAHAGHYLGLLCLSVALAWLFSSSSPQAHVISLWPPAGVALTGCLIFGQRFLPAVWLSSLVFNLTTLTTSAASAPTTDYTLPVIIACSSTIQAWVNYKILRARGLNPVNNPDYSQALFFLLSALGCCWIAPALTSTTLALTTITALPDLPQWNNMLVWWVGDFLGVILVTPLLLSLTLKPPESSQRSSPLRGLTLPLLLTMIIFQAAQQYIEAVMTVSARSEFSLKAKVAENSLKRDMNSYLASLDRLEGALSQEADISKARFATLVTALTASMPGIRAMSWNPLITQQQAATFEHRTRTDIDPTFSIKGAPLTPSDPMVVVQLIEPLEKNRMALGFNVFSNAARKQSMLHADRTHAATATDIIQLVQSDKKEPGFLIFAPVYQRVDRANHSLNSERYLKGFAVGVFLVAEMLHQSISDETINFINLYIYDNGNPASRVYGDPAIMPMISAKQGLSYTFEMPFAQHHWSFNLHMRPDQVIALQVSSSLTFLLAQAAFACLARVGGDEFTLLIENDPDSATLNSVVDKLITSLQAPIQLPGQSVRASISIGVAVFPRDADNLTDLMRAADTAMYQAKQSGQHSCFYQPSTPQTG